MSLSPKREGKPLTRPAGTAVLDAIARRTSCRACRADPVPEEHRLDQTSRRGRDRGLAEIGETGRRDHGRLPRDPEASAPPASRRKTPDELARRL